MRSFLASPRKLILGATLFSVALAAGSWSTSDMPNIDYGVPAQANAKPSAVIPTKVQGAVLRPRASYAVQAFVMRTARYPADDLAAISPVDFALAWGPVAAPSVQKRLEIRQHDRWFYWRVLEGDAVPLPRPAFEASIANTHMIPATHKVALALTQVRAGDSIRAKGYLVDIESPNPRVRRKTSLNRSDTGGGACEIFYVTEIEIGLPLAGL